MAAGEVTLDAPDAPAVLRALDAESRRIRGHEAFPDAVWSALAGDRPGTRVAVGPAGDVAAVAFGSDSFRAPHRQLGLAVRDGVAPDRVAPVLGAVCADEAAVVAWVPGSPPAVVEALLAAGFVLARRQFRMHVVLPVAAPRVPPGVVVRPFVVGRDEDAWLGVNNRAFAQHAEQGGWIREQLARRVAEDWFDAAGFLLAWRGDDLVGFCWTKVHELAAGPLGEIFVIGVDPSAHGHGYGRMLVLAGLADLADRRGCRDAILYVAEGNDAAIGLYESIGFTRERTDSALEWRRR